MTRRPPAAEGPAGTDTPMMGQYLRAKDAHRDAILLFRMGDFYETFFEDAELLSRVLGVALTSRNAKDANPIPLAGFPWHAAEPQIAKLLRAGHRVAICEQVEEPGAGKKLLERRVVEVLSPGTALGESLLDAGRNNFVLAMRFGAARVGIAAADVSTGEVVAGDLSPEQAREELERLAPAEIVASEEERGEVESLLRGVDLPDAPFQTWRDAWRFSRDRAERAWKEQLGVVTLEPFEWDDLEQGLCAAGGLLDYLKEQKQSDLGHLRRPVRLRPGAGLILDESTQRSLELLEAMPGAGRDSTLCAVVDHTRTAAGTRLLRQNLRRPLLDPAEIRGKQGAVRALLDERVRASLRALLGETSDVERILGRLHCNRATPRDLGALRATLNVAPRVQEALRRAEDPTGLPVVDEESLLPLATRLRDALSDSLPVALADGGVFRDTWDAELEGHRTLARDAKGWIAGLQEEERQKTGISGLKVGFNRVFGYYIEVSQSQIAKVPDRYQRKQTIANGERFLTPELKDFEQRVLSAEENMVRRERQLFEELCSMVRAETAGLQAMAAALAELDFLQSLAEAAARGGWVCPDVTDGDRIDIRDGRHPVVEAAIGRDRFVPNDLLLDGDQSQLIVLTGPNMAGKSTYLRQVGLIVVLAQIGSFVPAARAEIGCRDRIFTRVGAQDALARGQSTFLVEMVETSRILRHAGRRSLVLLDEVGRGTSTYDGLAIAWAVSEALSNPEGPRPLTLFATHFNELTRLARPVGGVKNWNVLVKEWGEEVVFLHKIAEGGADRSYGIHVARLAGVPEPVIARAREVLERLQSGSNRPPAQEETRARPGARQLSLFAAPEPPFLAELRRLDPDHATPLEALALLHRWREELKAHDAGQGG